MPLISVVLSIGSVNQGLTSGRARRAASMPMRPRDVIPVELCNYIEYFLVQDTKLLTDTS